MCCVDDTRVPEGKACKKTFFLLSGSLSSAVSPAAIRWRQGQLITSSSLNIAGFSTVWGSRRTWREPMQTWKELFFLSKKCRAHKLASENGGWQQCNAYATPRRGAVSMDERPKRKKKRYRFHTKTLPCGQGLKLSSCWEVAALLLSHHAKYFLFAQADVLRVRGGSEHRGRTGSCTEPVTA